MRRGALAAAFLLLLAAPAPAAAGSAHAFPLDGEFWWSDEGGEFGAKRKGHRHQGYDLIAPAGTPVVAPRGGVITTVAFQRDGAGHYAILSGAGENRSYVFMHMQKRSIRVRAGQRVRMGAQIGSVGSTGRSLGPHLHFEIWRAGRPIDPLPALRRWLRAAT